MSLDALVDSYLSHLRVERSLSANTVSSYGVDLARFMGFCSDRKLKSVRELDLATVSQFTATLAEQGLGPRSTARRLSAVRGFLRFLVKEGELASDPSVLAARPKLGRRLPRPLTEEETLRLLAAPDPRTLRGLRDRALLALAYAAGLRVSELVTLRPSDVDFRRGVVSALGKGNKRRLVPISETTLRQLLEYRELSEEAGKLGVDALFAGPSGKALTRQAFWKIARKYGTAAGIRGAMHPHRLRHSFATHLLAGGADLRSVQTMLGHASVATTEVYTLVTQDQVRKTHARTHPRG